MKLVWFMRLGQYLDGLFHEFAKEFGWGSMNAIWIACHHYLKTGMSYKEFNITELLNTA